MMKKLALVACLIAATGFAGEPALGAPGGGPGDQPDDAQYQWISGICCEALAGDAVRVFADGLPGGGDPNHCRTGRAHVRLNYRDGRYDVQVHLKHNRPGGYATWDQFRQAPDMWVSHRLRRSGNDQGQVRVAAVGEIVALGVVAVDPRTGRQVWARQWDDQFIISCGRDHGITLTDTARPR
ncbi:hypothetical protein [Actinoplanes sp. HUAS TT8]|uniref:hypothetical protein n=1 Tax=Actinoplanes sp. HUAS TT8 TaxID=3447453 RepID=UPI003F525065